MPSLTRIFTTGLIASVLAFTALGVAVADDEDNSNSGSGTGTSTSTTTTTTPTSTGGDSGSAGGDSGSGGEEDSSGKGKGKGKDPQPEHGRDGERGHKGPGSGELPPASAPVAGESVKAKKEKGKVLVLVPGATEAVELSTLASIPVGSIVDVRGGAVKLTAAGNQYAVFSGAIFKLRQSSKGRRPVTELVLRGGDLASCGSVTSPVASFSRRRPSKGRKLWGSGKGNFRTRGRHGAATVRGTTWLTADSCDGTLVFVKTGKVAVRDFFRKRSVLVETGQKYLAKPRPRKARRGSARS